MTYLHDPRHTIEPRFHIRWTNVLCLGDPEKTTTLIDHMERLQIPDDDSGASYWGDLLCAIQLPDQPKPSDVTQSLRTAVDCALAIMFMYSVQSNDMKWLENADIVNHDALRCHSPSDNALTNLLTTLKHQANLTCHVSHRFATEAIPCHRPLDDNQRAHARNVASVCSRITEPYLLKLFRVVLSPNEWEKT